MRKTVEKDFRTLEIFTTGDAAKASNLSLQTIIDNCNSGRLKSFRVPGSRFRRIHRADLVHFLRKNNIFRRDVTGARFRVLIVEPPLTNGDSLRSLLVGEPEIESKIVHSAFEAGMEVAKYTPTTLLIDCDQPKIDVVKICKSISRNTDRAKKIDVILVSAIPSEPELKPFIGFPIRAYLHKPVKSALLISEVKHIERS